MHPALLTISVILSVFAFFFLVYLFLIMTGSGKEARKYSSVKFAHRGLHGTGVAENSLTAFRLAAEKGYGIELDVRLSKDGVPVVFHDSVLERVTAGVGKVSSYDAEELTKMTLLGGEDTVPLFEDVLRVVDGRVPILVELKEEPGSYGVAEKALEVLSYYEGEYIVESFNPKTLGEVRKINPDILTGILCTNYFKDEKFRKPLFFAVQNFFTNILCRPDFVSYNIEDREDFSFRLFRRLFGVRSFAWTVCSEEQEKDATAHGFDTVIFEGYKTENRMKVE